MDVDVGALSKVLKDETRRRIVLLLYEKGSLAYMDLMNFLEIADTGKMKYHLKVAKLLWHPLQIFLRPEV